MKLSEEVDYLKNELKSYAYLKQYVKETKAKKRYELKRLFAKIKEVEEDINHNSPKSPSLGPISTSSYSNRDKPLSLVIKLDDLKEEIVETERNYDKLIALAEQRIAYIEESLQKIDEKEEEIIGDLYFNQIGFNKVCGKYGYSRSHLYRVVEKIIKKMLKKPQKSER